MSREILVVGGDVHFPFADPKAIKSFLKLIGDRKPDCVIINGDLLDETSLSKFRRVPSNKGFLEEVKEGKEFLASLRKVAPNSDIRFVAGNHDLRGAKRLLDKLPELYGILNLGELLGCENQGIAFIEDVEKDCETQWKDVLIGHYDVCRKLAGQTAQALLQDSDFNVIQNHVHRLAVVYRRRGERQLWAAEAGCLCSLEPDYKRRPDWCQGAIVVEWDGKRSEPTPIRF